MSQYQKSIKTKNRILTLAATPAEALKALLLPGEIADLAFEIEQLTGYRRSTIETVKNDSGAETTKS